MPTAWHGLLANFALMALFVSLWTHADALIGRALETVKPALLGLVFGAGAICLMMAPFQLQPGIFVDLRSVPIALSGVFGGPVAAVITLAMAIAYRYELGGAGLSGGMVGAFLGSMVGVVAWRLLKGRVPGAGSLVVIAAAVSLSGLPGLLMLPQALLAAIFLPICLPTMAAVFFAALIAGLAIGNDRRRQEISRANHLYRAIIETLPDSLNAKDLQGKFIAANPATARLMRAGSSDALLGKTDFDFFPEDVAAAFRRDEEMMLASTRPTSIEQAITDRDGTRRWLWTLKTPFFGPDGALMGIVTHNRDITEKRILKEELALSRQRLADALTNMADGLAVFDSAGRLVFFNQQYRDLFPQTADVRIAGAHYGDILRISHERGEELVSTSDIQAWIATAAGLLARGGTRRLSLSDGRWLEARSRPSEDGHVFIVYSDFTQTKRIEAELMALNRRLEVLASTDGLTGLANRRTFDRTLDAEMETARKSGSPLSVLLVDVDRFKAFNDTYGHQSGDDCLRKIAAVLQMMSDAPGRLAARYGGEELAMILPGTMPEVARALAEAVRIAIAGLNIPHAGSELRKVTVSIGVGSVDGGIGANAFDILKSADLALYQAKATGRDRVRSATDRRAHSPATIHRLG